jgi:hypothetical protein
MFDNVGEHKMYNARHVEAAKKREEKVKSLENMLRENAPSSGKQSITEKGLESDRTGGANVTTEKQLEKLREGTRDALVEKRLDDEKPVFGKAHRTAASGEAPKVHPLDADRKEPGKYKPANGKK